MQVTPYGWIAWSAVSTAITSVQSGQFEAVSSGLGPVGATATAGLVAAVGAHSVLRLRSVYGPLTAAGAPLLAAGAGCLGSGHGTAPAAVTVALAVLSHSARKVTAS